MGIFSAPRYKAQDSEGNVLVGAKVYFWEPGGTVTPKNSYAEASLVTPNANPLVTGSDGLTDEFWLLDEAYNVVVTDSDDVELESYDNYYPGQTPDEGKKTAASAGSDPALEAENTSSGPGVKAINSGTGYALEVEGDTSSPAAAAVHVVPQDNDPSSPVKGNIHIPSYGGRPTFYDGTNFLRSGVMYDRIAGGSVSAGTSQTKFGAKQTIPAASAVALRKMRTTAMFTIGAQSGTPNITYEILFGGVVIFTTAASFVVVGDVLCAVCDSILNGSSQKHFTVVGEGALAAGGSAGFYVNTTSINQLSTPIDIEFAVTRSGGTSATVSLDFSVEVF